MIIVKRRSVKNRSVTDCLAGRFMVYLDKGESSEKDWDFGGTFDPPHHGHLIIANEVRSELELDEIWFMPNQEPPHKKVAMK